MNPEDVAKTIIEYDNVFRIHLPCNILYIV